VSDWVLAHQTDPRTPPRSTSGLLLGTQLPHGLYYRRLGDTEREAIAVINGHVVAGWRELDFTEDELALCSPWNRLLADTSSIGMAIDQAMSCASRDPEPRHDALPPRRLWAAHAVLEGLLAFAQVNPESEEIIPLTSAIGSSRLVLAHRSERPLYSEMTTLRVGRSERIGDLWDIPALTRAWEKLDLPEELSTQECKALDAAQDMRVSDFVHRPRALETSEWSVMALITGDSMGYAAWQARQMWHVEQSLAARKEAE
jgi:hypothetical protein